MIAFIGQAGMFFIIAYLSYTLFLTDVWHVEGTDDERDDTLNDCANWHLTGGPDML